MPRVDALLALLLTACGGSGGGDGMPDASSTDAGSTDAGSTDATASYNPLDGIGTVEWVAGGFEFIEGPQWIAATGTLLFSDIPGDRIHELIPPATVTVFRTPSGNSNGLAVTAGGVLFAAEHGNRRVSTSAFAGAPTTLVDGYGPDRLNSPNDVIVRDDGTVYFTDPPYGIDDAARELDFIGVFRVPPGGDEPIAEWMGALDQRPNGIGLSPDQRTLYVADTADGVLRAWDITADGSLSGERVLSHDVPNADGLAVDAGGHLFVTTSAGVRVLGPDGATWGTIPVPEQPANCAFGGADGRTLYITARTSLYRVALAHPGPP